MNRTHTIVGLGIAIAWTGIAVLAGPINPPAGPVVSTAKPLSEVEPRTPINAANTPGDATALFKIIAPGSYYLTGNITGVAGKHGIAIAASGVTLDLNGFELAGDPAMGAMDGVSATVAALRNITVLNGSVRNWGGSGIDLQFNLAANCRIANVVADSNLGRGINSGNASTITNCSAYNSGSFGIVAGSGCVITSCSAVSNASTGIVATSAGTITGCTAYSNTGHGIAGNLRSTITDCAAVFNTLDGISCVSQCLIRAKTCASNGNGAGDGAGIHASGGDNRIEANNSTRADRGIDANAAGNIIIRNSCSGNTINWVIAANNVVGPILDRTAPASAAISGNSAPSSLGSTDPNANFSY